MIYEKPTPRAGHAVTAAVWYFDGRRMRLTQVCHEPRGRKVAEEPRPDRPRRGALAETQGRLL